MPHPRPPEPASRASPVARGDGSSDPALKALERACASPSAPSPARLAFASALGERHRVGDAIAQLDLVRARDGHAPEVASAAASLYWRLFRADLAIASLEALGERGVHPRVRAELAVYYEQVGRFGDAVRVLDACIEESPDRPEPRLVRARVLTHFGDLDGAEAELGRIWPVAPSHPPLLMVRALYQLGAVLDRKRDDPGAISAIERAKAIQRQSPAPAHLARGTLQAHERLATLHERIDDAILERWLRHAPPPLAGGLRPAHLLGFPRSGTTLLEQPLQAHPGLVTSSERLAFPTEVFPQVVGPGGLGGALEHADSLSPNRIGALRRRYGECLGLDGCDAPLGGVHLDKKPASTPLLFAILRVLPESRVLVAIRDPRDVVLSCYMTYFPPTDLSACFLGLRETCVLYTHVMRVWLHMRALIPPESWREVRYERVCADIVGEGERALAFLGLPPDPAVAAYLEGTRRAYVHSPSFAEVRRPAHTRSLGRWRRYEGAIRPYLTILQPMVEALGYGDEP